MFEALWSVRLRVRRTSINYIPQLHPTLWNFFTEKFLSNCFLFKTKRSELVGLGGGWKGGCYLLYCSSIFSYWLFWAFFSMRCVLAKGLSDRTCWFDVWDGSPITLQWTVGCVCQWCCVSKLDDWGYGRGERELPNQTKRQGFADWSTDKVIDYLPDILKTQYLKSALGNNEGDEKKMVMESILFPRSRTFNI